MNTFTDLDKSKLSYFHLDDLKAGNLGSAGPPGPVGPAGPIGPAGFNGTNGVDGADGINGVDGIDGPPGPQGPVGTTGPQGIQGVQGIQGNDGPPGADGNDGLNGVDGATGATGPQGPQGPQGVQGPAGPSGAAAVFIELVSQPLGYITFPTSTQLLTGTYFAVDQYATDGISFSGGAISVAQSGYYRVDVSLYVTGTGSQQRFYLDRRLNAGLGSFDTKGVYHVTGAGDQVYQFSTTVYLEATGAVTLRAVDLEPMANPVTVFFGGDHTKVTVTKVDGIQGLQGIQGPAGLSALQWTWQNVGATTMDITDQPQSVHPAYNVLASTDYVLPDITYVAGATGLYNVEFRVLWHPLVDPVGSGVNIYLTVSGWNGRVKLHEGLTSAIGTSVLPGDQVWIAVNGVCALTATEQVDFKVYSTVDVGIYANSVKARVAYLGGI